MKTGWIQVSDSVPEEGTNYRVAAKYAGDWMTPGWYLIRADQVTHGQPLEPPEDK